MRLIDADKMIDNLDEWFPLSVREQIGKIIDTQETFDVVRCKTCKYNILGECAVTNMIHQDESFCSWGVEK